MSKLKKAESWKLIDWDGNPALNLKCWRKKFGRGHISVGVGDFTAVVFSFGANSDDSFSSTRWNYHLPPITEQQAMDGADRAYENRSNHGYKWRHQWAAGLRPATKTE